MERARVTEATLAERDRLRRDLQDGLGPSMSGIALGLEAAFVRVVLADDLPMYRYGLSAVLAQTDAVEVVATVGNGRELLEAFALHRPGVVITDLSMPDLDGVAATRELVGRDPEVGVLVVTMHEDDQHVFAALRAGARGYLVKGADGDEIVRAVQAVANGDAVYGGTVARRIVSFYSGGADRSLPKGRSRS